MNEHNFFFLMYDEHTFRLVYCIGVNKVETKAESKDPTLT